MKKIFTTILIFIFNLGISNAYDYDRKTKLNKLFNELRVSNSVISIEIEQKIWKIWSTHPVDEKLTSLLAEGSNLVL